MWLPTDYSDEYSMMILKFIPITTYAERIVQMGICELTATLPSITQSGAGRGKYLAYYTQQMASYLQEVGIPFVSGKGVFFGAAPNGEAVLKIYGIYFVKK